MNTCVPTICPLIFIFTYANPDRRILILYLLEIDYTPNCCLCSSLAEATHTEIDTYQLHDISPLFRIQPVNLIRCHLENLYQDILLISSISKS
jgi:hypothetical protein